MPPPIDDAVMENVDQVLRLASACGADAAQMLASACLACPGHSLSELIDFLASNKQRIVEAASNPVSLRTQQQLPERYQRAVELSSVRPELGDSDVRGRLLFRDLHGKMSFWQYVVWVLAGIEIDSASAAALDELAVSFQLADVRIWPLTVVRRIAQERGALAPAIAAGTTVLSSPFFGPSAAAAAHRLLLAMIDARRQGLDVQAWVRSKLDAGEVLAGVGRPIFKRDERVAALEAIVVRYKLGRAGYVEAVENLATVVAERGLDINAAAWAAAIFGELGLNDAQTEALGNIIMHVPVVAQAAFSLE